MDELSRLESKRLFWFNGSSLQRVYRGQWCAYNLPREQVQPTIIRWLGEGADFQRITFNEAAPDHRVLLNGEYWTGADRLGYLFYSRSRAQMRDALRQDPHEAQGLHSWLLLKHLMTPSSWEDWLVLEQWYPDHVIELSIYECCLGDTPGRNTLVWEARRY